MKTSNNNQANERDEANAVALRDAITDYYMETGKPCSVAEVAPRLGWSTSKVYKVLDICRGAPAGIKTVRDERATYSKAYPGMQSGTARVFTFMPTSWRLRELLLAERAVNLAHPFVVERVFEADNDAMAVTG